MAKITAKDVLQMKWALEQGLIKPEAVAGLNDVDTTEPDLTDNSQEDRIMPGHVKSGDGAWVDDTLPQTQSTGEDLNNPVTQYVNELIVDLVSKKHIKFVNMAAVRSVFRGVLLRLCDGDPHTFSDIRSTITPTRRHFVKQILVCLQQASLIVEVELNNRLFYRADLEEIHAIRAYIIATEPMR